MKSNRKYEKPGRTEVRNDRLVFQRRKDELRERETLRFQPGLEAGSRWTVTGGTANRSNR